MMSRALLRLRSPITNSLTAFRPLSSSSWAAIYPDNLNADSSAGSGSEVYRDARKYARPATVTWSMRLHNSVSLIGTVKYPLKQYATKNGRFGVHTLLRVKTSPDSSFLISIGMWDELAQRAVLHLKPEDYIYISGELETYKTTSEGVEETRYKVKAKELNYVKLDEPGNSVVNSRKETSEYIGKSSLQNYGYWLHLWQIFFASPDEWYDNRNSKKNPRQPDFVHKSTGEALWLKEYDPPWVHKQLELIDSKRLGPMKDPTSICSYEWLSNDLSTEPNPTSRTNDLKIFK